LNTVAPDHGFWRTHLLWPLSALVAVFLAIELLGLDRPITHAVYYDDSAHRWLGGWWATTLVHNGGRWLARAIAACALAAWVASFLFAFARPWRRTSGYVFLAIALSVGLVGALKTVTNVDCPWDLTEFGGHNPYVPLFADRPDFLPHAECFPGAHASSGFAMFCFYFALRDRSSRKARWAFVVACLLGLTFSVGQEARGAHFVSHDLASAAIVWTVQLLLYAWLLRPRQSAAGPAGS
jgi:membrane-associated PAP2 superfamily phosphatase